MSCAELPNRGGFLIRFFSDPYVQFPGIRVLPKIAKEKSSEIKKRVNCVFFHQIEFSRKPPLLPKIIGLRKDTAKKTDKFSQSILGVKQKPDNKAEDHG